jgi:hypothetical protein
MKGDRLHDELPELLMGMIEELELKIKFSDFQDAANDRIPSGK